MSGTKNHRSREQIATILAEFEKYSGSTAEFCRDRKIDRRLLRRWRVNLLSPQWKSGKCKATNYTGDEKRAAVQAAVQFASVADAARALGIESDLLHRWRRAAQQRGLESLQDGNLKRRVNKKKRPFKAVPDAMPETNFAELTNEQLLREIEYLRAEVACLKKLKALTSMPAATPKKR